MRYRIRTRVVSGACCAYIETACFSGNSRRKVRLSMKVRASWWSAALVVAGLSLSLTAPGCGDDDDQPTAGSGASGSGGRAGTSSGGRGGAGAGGAGGGGAVTAATCTTNTKSFLDAQPSSTLSDACIECACEQNPKAINDCTTLNNGACWALLACANTNCPSDPSSPDIPCLMAKCGDYLLPGSTGATAAGPIIVGNACRAKCGSGGGEDAGVDAGN